MEAVDNDVQAATLQSICGGVSLGRAKELLEAANGSLERAVDIFFHQQQHEVTEVVDLPSTASTPSKSEEENESTATTSPPPTGKASSQAKKRSPSSKKKCPSPLGRKQARLDFFFGSKSTDNTTPSSSQLDIAERKTESKTIKPLESHDETPCSLGKVTGSSDLLEIVEIEDDPDTVNVKEQPMLIQNFDADGKVEQVGIQKPPANNAKNNPKECFTEVSFQRLAETLQQLTDTTKRLVKLDVLKEFISHIVNHPTLEFQSKTLTCGLFLILGFRGGGANQAPMEVGGSALSKALQTILGASRMQLSKGYRQYGDMGDAAASLFQKKSFFVTNTKSLTVVQVYESFEKIVATDGRDAKQHVLLQLLRACNSKIEIRFLVRLLIGNMRVGANLKTVLAALAMVFLSKDADTEETKKAVELVQKTHDVCPNLEAIVKALLKGGLQQVPEDCSIQLLTPIAPMLAHPIHSLEQVAKAMGVDEIDGRRQQSMTMEWKYDGVRCQAHYDGSRMKLFSRHMMETSEQYPDAAQSILAARRCDKAMESFIIDAEIVGVEGEGEDLRLLPFQDLSRRKKKNDNGQGVKVKVFAFDLMYINGVSLIDKCLEDRQAAMRQSFQETEDFAYVSSKPLPTFDEDEIRSFLEKAVEKGAEGLMLKMLGKPSSDENEKSSSPYEAGTRSDSWLKVKRDYIAGYADTIDVVPIGAWYGHGRKAQKSFLSPVLLAVYDEEEDVYRSISRCMSFTDAMYDAMREFYYRGIPYPAGVGIDGTDEQGESAENRQTLDNVEEKNDGDDDGEEDEDNGDESDQYQEEEEKHEPSSLDPDNGESLVNCFSSRPSSAYVVTNESPPIWFKPLEVFEVSFADMSLSRQHTAGAGLVDDPEGRGIALRFPRFKRRRPDKKPEQSTTSLQIAQLFAQQSKQGSSNRRSDKPQ